MMVPSIPSEAKTNPFTLAVDDDPISLRLLQAILDRNGYPVKTATSGEEALHLLNESLPSVLILDVEMPGLSGTDLCRQIKQDPRLRNLPVIFLSGKMRPTDYKLGHESGGLFYMGKPARESHLLMVLRMILPVPVVAARLDGK